MESGVSEVLRQLYSDHKLEQLIDYCSDQLSTDGSCYLYYGARGKAYLDLEMYQEAITDFTNALVYKPDYTIGLYNRGLSYLDTTKYELAIADFKQAAVLDSNIIVCHYIGLAYLSLGRNEEAITSFNQFLQSQFDKHVLMWRAEAHSNLGLLNLVLHDYESILRAESQESDYLEHLIRINGLQPVNSSTKTLEAAFIGELNFEKWGYVKCPHYEYKHFFPNTSGVYILEFSNGEFYVGQTKKLISRLRSHLKVFHDIAHVYFKQEPEKVLITEENKTIALLESQQYRLRNLKQISFNNLFGTNCQKEWLNDLNYNFVIGSKFKHAHIRAQYAERFDSIKQKSYFDALTSVLAVYIKNCIPNYIASEYSYWQITCLPKYLEEEKCVSRININSVPVLSVFEDTESSFTIMLVVSKLPFLLYLQHHPGFGDTFDDIPSLVFEIRNAFECSEGDEIMLFIDHTDFPKALSNELVLSAIRAYNLHMINKVGSEVKYRRKPSHCLDLADFVFNKIKV